MNEKEEAFLKDLNALLNKYRVVFNVWEEYGGDDSRLCDEYVFEDDEDMRLELDEVIKYLWNSKKGFTKE